MNKKIILIFVAFITHSLTYASCDLKSRNEIIKECKNPICVYIINNATPHNFFIKGYNCKLNITRYSFNNKNKNMLKLGNAEVNSLWVCPNQFISTALIAREKDGQHKMHCGIFKLVDSQKNNQHYIEVKAYGDNPSDSMHFSDAFLTRLQYNANNINTIGIFKQNDNHVPDVIKCTPISYPRNPEPKSNAKPNKNHNCIY